MEYMIGYYDSPSEHLKSLVEQFRSSETLLLGINREDILVIEIDSDEWYRLKGELGLGGTEEYPKFLYDPLFSRLSVEWMPLPLHEFAVRIFSRAFYDCTRHIQLICRIRKNHQFQQLEDKNYVPLLKVPNLALLSGKRSLILEVGSSQIYNQLVDTARFWLEEKLNVTRVVTVNITEPKYSCPIKKPGFLMLASLGLPTNDQNIKSMFHLESSFGPVMLGDTQWVGKIDMFLEVWKYSKHAREPERHGSTVYFRETTPPAVPLRLSDFLEVDLVDDRSIVIDWEGFQRKLKEALLETAFLRYREMLVRCYEREDSLRM